MSNHIVKIANEIQQVQRDITEAKWIRSQAKSDDMWIKLTINVSELKSKKAALKKDLEIAVQQFILSSMSNQKKGSNGKD
jgi:protein subunit release factor A